MNITDRQCVGKQRHPSPGAAQAHVRALVAQTGVDPMTLQAYACVLCGGWHVGRLRQGTVARRQRRQQHGY
jgi:hypothetical protein